MSFPDHKALALRVRSINEDLPFIKANFEGTDDSVLAQSQSELLRFVDLISNVIVTMLNEKDLVHFVKLVMNGFPRRELHRLKLLQHFNHKVLIVHVVPRIVCVRYVRVGLLLELKEFLEVPDEDLEQEFAVQLLLHIWWQFIKDLEVSLGANGDVLVILPPVCEVLLDFDF